MPKALIHSHQSVISFIQHLSDIGIIFLTLQFTIWLFGYHWYADYTKAALTGMLLYYLIAEINGLYISWRGASISLELKSIIWTWFWVIVILLLIAFVTKESATYSRMAILSWFVLTPIGIGLWRLLIRVVLRKLRYLGYNLRRIAIAGNNDLGKRLLQTIQADASIGMEIIGAVSAQFKNLLPADNSKSGYSIPTIKPNN
ncbi:MAG: hypothetical protein KAI83_01620 [Thiomargarita sp.]|nr:hypothetical protein [Thiomargarita sp.]